jgi:N-acetylneuraminate synthase
VAGWSRTHHQLEVLLSGTLPSFATDLIQTEPWPIHRHVLVIAEIGINHNGDIAIAKQLIDMAKAAGCDAVKFQKRTIDKVYPKEQLESKRESPWGTTFREQKEGLEFGAAQFDEIDKYCKAVGIDWFASAWDVESQEFLRRYKLKYNKIASPMLGHADLLEAVASEGRPTFISVGMSTWEEVDAAVAVFRRAKCPHILMHCLSEYPAPEHLLNLRIMHELRARYGVPVAYSGHEVTPIPSVIAAAMGACAIERHITLDRAMYGSDQAASLERRGLEMMVGYTRTIPVVAGDGVKRVTDAERANAAKLRYYMGPLSGAPKK